MTGPIDYIIVGFEGNKFDGSILSALNDAIDNGVIRLVTLAVITKDANGVTSTIDITNLGEEYDVHVDTKDAPDPSLVTADDVREVSDLLENNTSAGMLVVEHLWAAPLKKALLDANGVLIADGRIHPDAAAELAN